MVDPNMENNDSSQNENHSRGKIVQLLVDYDLEDLGDDLIRRWTASENRSSLRELAKDINKIILSQHMREAGMDPVEGEAENFYRLLTDEGVTPGSYTQAKRRLERRGINVEELIDDFVSRQAVHTYLTNYRNATYPTRSEDRLKRDREYLSNMKRRNRTITENKLQALVETDRLNLGEFTVVLDLQVFCEDCQSQYDMVELLERAECDCEDHR